MKRKGISILRFCGNADVLLQGRHCYGAGTTAEVHMTENIAATEADSVIKGAEENNLPY